MWGLGFRGHSQLREGGVCVDLACLVEGLVFSVWCLVFGVWGLGIEVWGLGFGFGGLRFGVWGLGVWGLGYTRAVQGPWVLSGGLNLVSGFGFWVSGLQLLVEGFESGQCAEI